jgi:hypothetical protein
MTANSPDQRVHGYNYVPYQENGPYQQLLENTAKIVGNVIGSNLPATMGGKIVGALIGDAVGGILGKTAGFYIDTASNMEQNMITFTQQINDYNTWSSPGFGDFDGSDD